MSVDTCLFLAAAFRITYIVRLHEDFRSAASYGWPEVRATKDGISILTHASRLWHIMQSAASCVKAQA